MHSPSRYTSASDLSWGSHLNLTRQCRCLLSACLCPKFLMPGAWLESTCTYVTFPIPLQCQPLKWGCIKSGSGLSVEVSVLHSALLQPCVVDIWVPWGVWLLRLTAVRECALSWQQLCWIEWGPLGTRSLIFQALWDYSTLIVLNFWSRVCGMEFEH